SPLTHRIRFLLPCALLLAACGTGAEVPASGTNDSATDSAAAPVRDTVVTLDSAGQRLAGISLVTVATAAAGQLVANGTITYDANRVAIVAPRTEGRVTSVRADLGQRVRSGAVLAWLESPDVGELRGELQRAKATVEITRKNYEREQRLNAQQISSQKELLDAESAFRTAQADLSSATARLRAIGAGEGEGAQFGLWTPVAGIVVERNASPGQIVGPERSLFTVADLRHVWIMVDVYEGDLSRVREGAAATVIPTAFSDQQFHGRVTYAGGVVDTTSRAFKVRVEVENPQRRLRPGMFAEVRIESPAGSGVDTAKLITVPEEAVQTLDGAEVVFVAAGPAGRFVMRRIRTVPGAGDGMLRVTDGLVPGERIVAAGAFQLKAELAKASFGEEE
ncbi:MAG TPA: efflux RND transporter periplasmic adaptor subunit, partial [Gemmatimonadales bacterium]|nr:efflux RND transporter periplasmic adaptor subunit [Gemmatimonadales bacterium]